VNIAKGVDDRFVKTDLNTLLTALYVRIDDWLGRRPRMGRKPKLTYAELLTLAVAQVLLGVRSEARWLRYVPEHLPGAFPYLPGQSGYCKRLHRALPLLKRAIRALATDTDLWHDSVWVTDSTPIECGRSRPTAQRSDLAGSAGYGYCRSHSSRPSQPRFGCSSYCASTRLWRQSSSGWWTRCSPRCWSRPIRSGSVRW
jgi:hypothetical protein